MSTLSTMSTSNKKETTRENTEFGNSTSDNSVSCIIRDPSNYDKFRRNLRILCDEKGSKYLVITFERESVSFNGLRRVDFQKVVEGRTFEFPKNFFTCLLVPKGESVQVIVAKSSLLDQMPTSQRFVRIYLTGGDLTINGQSIDDVRVNRESRIVTFSSSHGSSISLHRSRSCSIRPLSCFKGKMTPATTPQGDSLPKQLTLKRSGSVKSGNVFSSPLSTKPGNIFSTPPSSKYPKMSKSPSRIPRRKIPEKKGEEIKVRGKFSLRKWFDDILTRDKIFDPFKAFPGHDIILAPQTPSPPRVKNRRVKILEVSERMIVYATP